jgi:hypothetical protein
MNLGTPLSVLLACATAGCLYDPFQETVIPSTTSPVTFHLYALSPGDIMYGECARHYPPWHGIGARVARTEPMELNGYPLYPVNMEVVLPVACWDRSGGGRPFTQVRFFQQHGSRTDQVFVFDSDGAACVSDELEDGETPVTAGLNCGRRESLWLQAFR